MKLSLVLIKLVVCWLCLLQGQAAEGKCKVIPLSQRREIQADTVFSGSVISIFVPRRPPALQVWRKAKWRTRRKLFKPMSPLFGAKVMVKRVFRGRVEGLIEQGQEVVVEGLGNPKICVARPRLADTRLFFTDRIHNVKKFQFPGSGDQVAHLKLKSSLLRINLPNLRVLWRKDSQASSMYYNVYMS